MTTQSSDFDEKAHPERYFKARGKRLWREMDGDQLPPLLRVVLEEACRLADTLDKLNAIALSSKQQWMELIPDDVIDSGVEITITVNPILGERRQTALALRQLISEIRSALKFAQDNDSSNADKEDGSDEFSRRRAERIANAGNR